MPDSASSGRLQSLDLFRGYTVAGMFLVNFLGGYRVCPQLWKHSHDYCSYADTIMPQFLFAAGFALRLSFLKHRRHGGGREAWLRMLRRAAGLALIAVAWYSFTKWGDILQSAREQGWPAAIAVCAKRHWMQTLLHIALTSVWIMPVLRSPLWIRLAYALASVAAHVAFSAWFNFLWVNGVPGGVAGIDGGPLAFLTWSVVALVGTWACDVCLAARADASAGKPTNFGPALVRMLSAGALLAGLGWLLSCGTTIYDVPPEQQTRLAATKFAEHPVIPSGKQLAAWSRKPAEAPFVAPPPMRERKWNYWMMSQRAGTPSYATFSAGFSLLVFSLFVWLADVHGVRIGLFRTLGVNALAGYLLADLADPLAVGCITALGYPVENSSAAWIVAAAFLLHFLLIYAMLRLMELRGIYLRM